MERQVEISRIRALVTISSVTAADKRELNLPQGLREEEYFDHINKINDVFYDQIKLSDQKAAYIFTFMMALLVTSSQAKAAFVWHNYITGSPATVICSACLALCSTVTMLFAIYAVVPRHARKSTSLFWGTWPSQRSAFERAAHARGVEYLFRQYLDNADILAGLARQKFRFVRLAFLGMIGTVMFYILVLICF
jgi:hypothetical protein